jgi:hypothetical protein
VVENSSSNAFQTAYPGGENNGLLDKLLKVLNEKVLNLGVVPVNGLSLR